MPINKNNINRYMNPVFIETGSHIGRGIESALEAGFEKIYSIELSEDFYFRCKEKFKKDFRVCLILGDSAEKLKELLDRSYSQSEVNITFWLDSHWSGDGTAKGKKNSPLLEELEAIKSFYIKGNIIMIDDLRCCGDKDEYGFGFTEGDIINKLLELYNHTR